MSHIQMMRKETFREEEPGCLENKCLKFRREKWGICNYLGCQAGLVNLFVYPVL